MQCKCFILYGILKILSNGMLDFDDFEYFDYIVSVDVVVVFNVDIIFYIVMDFVNVIFEVVQGFQFVFVDNYVVMQNVDWVVMFNYIFGNYIVCDGIKFW